MANVKPKTKPYVVNLQVGKHSYISLINPDNTFTANTRVVTVQDAVHGLEWMPKVSKWKAGELRVRLKALPRSMAKKKDHRVTDTPIDSGTLTVTITSPVKPVDPVPVDYVNDDETP
jgi:hypothetical protein